MPTTDPPIVVEGVSHRYGSRIPWTRPEGPAALDALSLSLPAGGTVALLGANGAGKSTLLRILAGMQRPSRGKVRVLGHDPFRRAREVRGQVTVAAEGLSLPPWMRLGALERWLAPLYPAWDADLAGELRERFGLDPNRRIGSLSRGEHRKAALLCAMAPRPRILLLDEPFGGVDVGTREALARGLLAAGGGEGWTVVVASHEVTEMETLADHLLLLDRGRLRLHAPLEEVLSRYRRVEVQLDEAEGGIPAWVPPTALGAERAGRRLSFVVEAGADGALPLPSGISGEARASAHRMGLRELYLTLAREAA